MDAAVEMCGKVERRGSCYSNAEKQKPQVQKRHLGLNYFAFVLLGFPRFANAFVNRRLEPRFLWATPDVADCTIYDSGSCPLAWLDGRSVRSDSHGGEVH